MYQKIYFICIQKMFINKPLTHDDFIDISDCKRNFFSVLITKCGQKTFCFFSVKVWSGFFASFVFLLFFVCLLRRRLSTAFLRAPLSCVPKRRLHLDYLDYTGCNAAIRAGRTSAVMLRGVNAAQERLCGQFPRCSTRTMLKMAHTEVLLYQQVPVPIGGIGSLAVFR